MPRTLPLCFAVPHPSAMLSAVLHITMVQALDNGLALTPPRGWRSWNAYDCTTDAKILTQAHMAAQMAVAVDRSRLVGGKPTSLADLGFDYISMDDGWQECNCSERQNIDPRKPPCPDLCFHGQCTFHDKNGVPKIRKDRFPDMKALVRYGHSLGLKVGGYLNTCICMEAAKSATHYQQDVDWFTDIDFDEVKIDACGNAHNVTLWAALFNATGKAIRIENCHNSWPDFKSGYCPMNFFRSGGDIAPDILSIVGEAYSTVDASDLPEPRSGPGCWAYPDMSEVGNFPPGPDQVDKERTHWGLWTVISSPLILGFDMNNSAIMDRVWPIITNVDALAVSKAWAGHPGTLIKVYPAVGQGLQVVQGVCDGTARTLGWRFENGSLVAPMVDGMALPHCVRSGAEGFCPPPTTRFSDLQCGIPLDECPAKPAGVWNYSKHMVQWFDGNPSDPPQCLGAFPKNFDTSKGYFTRQAATVKMQGCTALASMRQGSSCSAARKGVGVRGARIVSSADPASACNVSQETCCSACDRDASCKAYWWKPSERQAPACKTGSSYCWLLSGYEATHTAAVDGGTFGIKGSALLPVLGITPLGPGSFNLTDKGELRTAEGNCLTVEPVNGVQLWSKPLSNSSIAIILVNTLPGTQSLSFPLADVPHFKGVYSKCVVGKCVARDIWEQTDMNITVDHLAVSLKPWASAFFILSQLEPETEGAVFVTI